MKNHESKPKGMAIVKFLSLDDSTKGLKLSGSELKGKNIVIEYCKP